MGAQFYNLNRISIIYPSPSIISITSSLISPLLDDIMDDLVNLAFDVG